MCKLTNPKVPYFNGPIFLENKTQVGKVEEIFGPINASMFTIKMAEGVVASSYSKGDKFHISPDKLLPMERFLGGGGGGGGGRGGGRGPRRQGRRQGAAAAAAAAVAVRAAVASAAAGAAGVRSAAAGAGAGVAAGKRARRGMPRARFATTHARSSTRHRLSRPSVADPTPMPMPGGGTRRCLHLAPLRDGNAPYPREGPYHAPPSSSSILVINHVTV